MEDEPIEEHVGCKLIGRIGILVQFVMGTLVVLALISKEIYSKNKAKRYLEHPRRSWRIFFMDVSKQLIGGAWIHTINTVFSVVYGERTSTDQCGW